MDYKILARRKSATAFLTSCDKGVYYNNKHMMYTPQLMCYVKFANIDNIAINTRGGGINSQICAARLALAKYIVMKYPQYKSELIKIDPYILTSDGRQNEPKSAQCRGARRRRQKSYR